MQLYGVLRFDMPPWAAVPYTPVIYSRLFMFDIHVTRYTPLTFVWCLQNKIPHQYLHTCFTMNISSHLPHQYLHPCFTMNIFSPLPQQHHQCDLIPD